MHNLQHGCKHDVIVHSLSVLLLQPRLQVDHIELALAMNLLSLIQYARVPSQYQQGQHRDITGTMQGQCRNSRGNRDSTGTTGTTTGTAVAMRTTTTMGTTRMTTWTTQRTVTTGTEVNARTRMTMGTIGTTQG